MPQICPVCNGMVALFIPCPECGKVMEDQGHASDYFGPYSPYEEDFSLHLSGHIDTTTALKCVHFLQCPACKKYAQRAIAKIFI